jgi:phage terminase large subunit-like protein
MPRRKRRTADDVVCAADIIEFIETVCFIPEGRFVGKKLKLFDWQKDLIRLIYDNPHGTRRALISMGRKNAKTTLSAVCCWRTCAARRPRVSRIPSSILPRRAVTRPALFFRWRPRWCG